MEEASGGIAAFMAARYDEAEALAKAATPGAWYAIGGDILTRSGDPHWDGACAANATGADAAHIAANDPAHRLRDIALKRAILAEHSPDPHLPVLSNWCKTCDGEYGYYPCRTARQLGTEFSDHPGYQSEKWKP